MGTKPGMLASKPSLNHSGEEFEESKAKVALKFACNVQNAPRLSYMKLVNDHHQLSSLSLGTQ